MFMRAVMLVERAGVRGLLENTSHTWFFFRIVSSYCLWFACVQASGRVCQTAGCVNHSWSVPLSRVSFGRGVGPEGKSSGVKDKRNGRLVLVHYTVTQHLQFLSPLLSHSCGNDLPTWDSSVWGPYWQDNFGMFCTYSQWILKFHHCVITPEVCRCFCWLKEFTQLFPVFSHYGFSKTHLSGSQSWTQHRKLGTSLTLLQATLSSWLCVPAPPAPPPPFSPISHSWWGWETGQLL